jgi:putative transposase
MVSTIQSSLLEETSSCSPDLRKKVIDYINEGKINKEAAEIFGLHRNTISRWKLSYVKNGSYAAKLRLGYKSRLDYLSIEMFIKDNPDLKLSDIGVKFL